MRSKPLNLKVKKMAEIKCVINDVKSGKSYQKAVSVDVLMGKKLHDKVDGSVLGMAGYELEITGGSDNAGFPMRNDLLGSLRKKVLISGGPGVNINRGGMRVRKTVRGNTIDEDIAQINFKITKYGKYSVEKALGLVQEEAPKEEAKAEAPKSE